MFLTTGSCFTRNPAWRCWSLCLSERRNALRPFRIGLSLGRRRRPSTSMISTSGQGSRGYRGVLSKNFGFTPITLPIREWVVISTLAWMGRGMSAAFWEPCRSMKTVQRRSWFQLTLRWPFSRWMKTGRPYRLCEVGLPPCPGNACPAWDVMTNRMPVRPQSLHRHSSTCPPPLIPGMVPPGALVFPGKCSPSWTAIAWDVIPHFPVNNRKPVALTHHTWRYTPLSGARGLKAITICRNLSSIMPARVN